MKRPGIDGGFWLCFVLNLILTAQWSIPAWILLACHFAFGISLVWFAGALGLWLAAIFLMVCFFSWLSRESVRKSKPPLTPQEREERKRELARKSRAVGADFQRSLYSDSASAAKDE